MSQSDDECGRRRADHDIQSSPDKKEVDRSKEGKEGKECKEKETKKKPSDVCRDYLRNVCKRKKHCKFTHPAGRKGTEGENGLLIRSVCGVFGELFGIELCFLKNYI